MTQDAILHFTPQEIFTSTVAIISIVINIIQWQKSRLFIKPIYNGMLGLFNDIKSKILPCYQKQAILFNADNPHKDAETLRWDFYEFAQQIISYLEGFKEHIVAVLKSMEKSEKEIFKAAEFGLTEDEKIRQKEFLELWHKRSIVQQFKQPQSDTKDKK